MQLGKVGLLVLQGSQKLRQRIQDMERVTPQTVNRWIRDNEQILTKIAIINAIKEETGLTEDQLVEEVTEGEAK